MKRAISTILTLVLLFCTVLCGSGCEESNLERYHAIIIADLDALNEDFIYKRENMIDCVYKNRDYDPNDPLSEKYIYDSTCPASRLIFVTEQMLNDEVFGKIPKVDLETQTVAIVLFSIYGNYSYGLKNIEINDDVLRITIMAKHWGMLTEPVLVGVVIQFDKLEFSDSELLFSKN